MSLTTCQTITGFNVWVAVPLWKWCDWVVDLLLWWVL
jgi:hypothetical protein